MQVDKSEGRGLGFHGRGRRELGGSHGAIHHRHVRARRGRAHLAGRGVRRSSIGRKGMVVAARTLALAGVELFENPAEVQAAKEAFEKRLAGRHWTTRIAADSKPPLDYATK